MVFLLKKRVAKLSFSRRILKSKCQCQQTFNCSKSTIEIVKKGCKTCSMLLIKKPERCKLVKHKLKILQNLFKDVFYVFNHFTSRWCLHCLLWADLTLFSSVSISLVDFEQVNICWKFSHKIFKLTDKNTTLICQICSKFKLTTKARTPLLPKVIRFYNSDKSSYWWFENIAGVPLDTKNEVSPLKIFLVNVSKSWHNL